MPLEGKHGGTREPADARTYHNEVGFVRNIACNIGRPRRWGRMRYLCDMRGYCS